MKGFVENTIPQRQYENIKVRIYFETEDEKEAAIEATISDCIKYKDVVKFRVEEASAPKDFIPMEPDAVVKFLKLPEGTKLKRVFNKDIGEYMYFDQKTGVHFNHPKVD